jgi:hypothetical protein
MALLRKKGALAIRFIAGVMGEIKIIKSQMIFFLSRIFLV